LEFVSGTSKYYLARRISKLVFEPVQDMRFFIPLVAGFKMTISGFAKVDKIKLTS